MIHFMSSSHLLDHFLSSRGVTGREHILGEGQGSAPGWVMPVHPRAPGERFWVRCLVWTVS